MNTESIPKSTDPITPSLLAAMAEIHKIAPYCAVYISLTGYRESVRQPVPRYEIYCGEGLKVEARTLEEAVAKMGGRLSSGGVQTARELRERAKRLIDQAAELEGGAA